VPETRPPIELQGLSLGDLQAMIDERRLIYEFAPLREYGLQ
jgi:hypothetical protein